VLRERRRLQPIPALLPAPRCHPAALSRSMWQERCPQCPACQGQQPSAGLVLAVPDPSPVSHALAAPRCDRRLVTLRGPAPPRCHHCPFMHAASAQQSMGPVTPVTVPFPGAGGPSTLQEEPTSPSPAQVPAPPLRCLLLQPGPAPGEAAPRARSARTLGSPEPWGSTPALAKGSKSESPASTPRPFPRRSDGGADKVLQSPATGREQQGRAQGCMGRAKLHSWGLVLGGCSAEGWEHRGKDLGLGTGSHGSLSPSTAGSWDPRCWAEHRVLLAPLHGAVPGVGMGHAQTLPTTHRGVFGDK